MSEVVLVGRAELDAIYQSLKKMQDQASSASDELSTFGKKTQEGLDRQTKHTETSIKKTGSSLRRLANQLYSDFKGLLSLEALQSGMKLSSQFKGAIGESILLGDTIRRIGGSFNVAKQDFGRFQGALSRGLGDIGASSEAAAAALEGLKGMGVNASSAIGLSKGAVTLAGMSGEKGNEKGIAGLLGRTLQAQGADINDKGAQQKLIGEVTAAVTSTGKQSSEILGAMEQIFSTMDKSLRGKMGPEGMAQMAVMATTVGPAATKALQEYLSKGAIQRLPLEAQGFNIMGENGGIDMKALKTFVDTTRGRIGGDPRASLQSAGFSEEASEGLVRLADQTAQVTENLKKLDSATRDNETAFMQSMGMLDAFKGSINTIKGRIEEWSSGMSQTVTDFFAAQVGDAAGSGAVAVGGATLAAILAGGGLRGIGKQLGSGLGGYAKKEAYESVTGEKVQNVFVVNASEIGGGVGGAAANGLGMLGKAGAVGAAGGVGALIGSQVINPLLDKFTQTKTSEGFEGNAVEALFFKLDKLLGGSASAGVMKANQQMKVVIETKEPNLRATEKVSRGTSN